MLDLLSADAQDVVATIGRSKGLVLMCPPANDPNAATTLAAVCSAIKKGTKVRVRAARGAGAALCEPMMRGGGGGGAWRCASP